MSQASPAVAGCLAYLVHGEDPGLVFQEVGTLLENLTEVLGEEAHSVVEDYGDPGREESLDIGAVLNACRTPPFLTSCRIVVVRDVVGLDSTAQKELVAYLADPLETTVLVLVASGRAPAALVRAVAAAGTVIAAQPAGNARARAQWIAERVRSSPVSLDASATSLLGEHLGEDLARLEGILGALESAYGPGAHLGTSELTPFLGEEGGVAPYDLSDAIDAGDTPGALRALHRLSTAGERHPLQVLGALHRHYSAMLRLDGSEATTEAAAAAATGLSPFPARKALAQSRRLGHEKVARAVTLLADADLDVRGRVGTDPGLVLEVLVARLAQLSRISAGAATSRSRRR